jgi:hypothetical protein
MNRLTRLALGAVAAVTGVGALAIPASSTAAVANVPWTHVDDNPVGCATTCLATPPAGPGASLAYDPATRQLILFGENNSESTWSWNGTRWQQIDDATDPGCTSTCAGSPPSRNTYGFAYDSASRALIMFGGNGNNDTWAWNGTSWTQVADSADPGCTSTCTASPPAVLGTQMAFDTATNQMVLFGGSSNYSGANLNDTWILSYHGGTTYTWAQVDDSVIANCTQNCTSSPPGRNVAEMAYDPATAQLVVFGGEQTAGNANGLNDTWTWNGSKWRQVDDDNGYDAGCGSSSPLADPCPSSPPGRVAGAMAYDPAIGELVLFGGMVDYNNPEYNDTWGWNGTVWTHLDATKDPHCINTCTASPAARDLPALADDPATDQVVLYGGNSYQSGAYVYNDTWVARAVPPGSAVPSTPLGVTATPAGSRIVVSWRAPSSSGLAPVIQYQVSATPGSETCVSPHATHCTLSGLKTTLHYTISVTATSVVGSGPAAIVKGVRG